MFRFFRQIRHAFIVEIKSTKYLKYAIGEILLVVIGILIALQINNWNEARKTRIVEIELLKTIKTDLDRTLVDLQDDYDNHLSSQKSGNKFKRFLLGENLPEDSIIIHFSNLSQDRHFFPNSSGYESLKSSDMNLVSNNSLRLMITQLYELNFPRIKEWDESNPRWDIGNMLYPYLKKHFTLTDQEIGNDFTPAPFPRYKLKLRSLDAIKADNDLQIDLHETFQFRSRKIALNKTGIEEVKRVLFEINVELERIGAMD